MATGKLGDTLLISNPYCHALSHRFRGKYCDECLKGNTSLQSCSGCSVVKYCHISCQKKAWKFHKVECANFKRISPDVPKESVLLFLRQILRYKNGDHVSHFEKFGDKRRCFEDLMSHKDDILVDSVRMSDFTLLVQTLRAFVGEKFEFPPSHVTLEIFGKMTINSFSICNGEMLPIGVGLYLGPSSLDHSCRPNAVIVFNGTELRLQLTETSTNSQQQIFISYIDQLSLRATRHQQLEQQYYFSCNCDMCNDQQLEELMTSSRCQSLDCDSPIYQKQDGSFESCGNCSRKIDDEESYKEKKEQISKKSEAILKELIVRKQVRTSDSSEMLRIGEDLLKQQLEILHPMNVQCVQCLDRLFDACIGLGQWEKALDYGQRTVKPYRRYYPRYHPNVGIQLNKIGKIQLHLRQLPEALQTLQQAESILSITHGKFHSVYQDLLCLLQQCSHELNSID